MNYKILPIAPKALQILTSILTAAYEEGYLKIISRKKKLEHREVKLLAQGHTATVRVHVITEYINLVPDSVLEPHTLLLLHAARYYSQECFQVKSLCRKWDVQRFSVESKKYF